MKGRDNMNNDLTLCTLKKCRYPTIMVKCDTCEWAKEREDNMTIQENIDKLTTSIQGVKDFVKNRMDFFTSYETRHIASKLLNREMVFQQGELSKLEEQLKQQGVYDSMWRPARSGYYWFINMEGKCRCTAHNGTRIDLWNITTNNTYQTEYHCKKAIEAEILKGEIREFARVENGEWRADWTKGDHKCYLYVNNIVPEVRFSWFNSHDHLQKLPNFRTETIAKKAIKKFGDRIQELQAYI